MSYEQDPNDQANISGADLAILIDQKKALEADFKTCKKLLDAAIAREKHTREALRKVLAAAQGQEPVGYVGAGFITLGEGRIKEYADSTYKVAVYLAPIPQQPAEPAPVSLGLVKTLKLAIDALDTSNDCIQAMTDGPGHAAWGNQLDKNELSIAELTKELAAAPQPKEPK